MTLDVPQPDPLPSAADGRYTYPSARDRGESDRPALLWVAPAGRQINELERLQAERRTVEQEWLRERRDEALEQAADPPDDNRDWMGLVIPDAVVEQAAESAGLRLLRDADDGEVEDDDIIDAYSLRRQMLLMECPAPRDLHDDYLDWCVDQTVGVEQVTVGGEPIDWQDDDVICDQLGMGDARAARRWVIDQFGAETWERKRAAFQYADWIDNNSGLDDDKKKR